MKEVVLKASLWQYQSVAELPAKEQALVALAYKHAQKAYAPFSNFAVGCSILLANGESVGGSNQENASYPAGICAERVALSTAASLYPDVAPLKIVVVVNQASYSSPFAAAPCGICRQSINEAEGRYGQEIEIIFPGKNGGFLKAKSIQSLLPLSFQARNLEL